MRLCHFLREGTLLHGGSYRIVRFIGSGGFGCTYEAVHTVMEERVAVKELFARDFCYRDGNTSQVSVATESKKELFSKLRRKFIEEAKALYRLRHPGIVRVSDVFEENGTAYYVMDYIAGKSLQDLLKQYGRLPESEALGYIRQVSEALRYVHGHNRLHLDIKPGNIMVDRSGSAVLIDFGASKQYDEANGENTSTLLGHTPGYAPPEQMCNSVRQFTPSTDIYALGATLYKLLTGETPVESALRISGEDMAPLPVGISPSTRSAVESAMVLDKRSRPQSVGEFLRILGQGTVTDSPGRKCHTVYDTYEDTEFDETEHDKTIDPSSTSGSGRLQGYAWVDLGLSVLWATSNVGASSPSDYGDYYAWGETKTKSSYTEGNSKTYNVVMPDISGEPKYDAATANWGEGWRMPTKEELEELVDKCDWEWTSQSGRNGYKVTGPNGNSIFLPAAVWRYGTSLNGAGDYGNYWSSTPYGSNTLSAYNLYFNSGDLSVDCYYRNLGQSVRPVTDK